MRVYHVTWAVRWDQAATTGFYESTSYRENGFVRCSWADAIEGHVNRTYRGAEGLVLLVIDPVRLGPLLGVDDGEPRVYGPLPVTAVERVVSLVPEHDGRFDLRGAL